MSIRKFNVELTKKDPFLLSKKDLNHTKDITWDWNFENKAYNTKKDTIKEHKKMIGVIVKNRDTAEYVAKVCMIDIPNMDVKVNYTLISFFQSFFTRMVKTSKVIQDLSIQGSYVESKALLRTNFERAVLIEYFSKNVEMLKEYLEAKKSGNKNISGRYSIKNLVEKIKKDYKEYTYLCHFAHPNLYDEDFTFLDIDGELVGFMQAYNVFNQEEFVTINYWNNNLLMESFLSIMNYMKKELPEEKIDAPLRRVLNMIKKLKYIKTTSSEHENTCNKGLYKHSPK